MISRILVIQTAFLGDLILTTPLFYNLNKIFPNAEIVVLALKGPHKIIENIPYIKVVSFDKKKSEKGIRGIIKIVKILKNYNFDVLISPHRSFKSGLIGFLLKIPKRIAFNKGGARIFATDVVEYKKNIHETIRNLYLLTKLGIENIDKLDNMPKLYLKEETNYIFSKYEIIKPYLTIAPGSVWFTKKWPQSYYIELIKLLNNNFSYLQIVIIGGKEDYEFSEELSKTDLKDKVIDLIGETTLHESLNIIKESELLISNDSAPIHLASAVNTPVIAIFGPTVREFGFFPLSDKSKVIEIDLKCRPCGKHGGKKCKLGHHDCMKKILPIQVFDEIKNFLNSGGKLKNE